MGSTSRTWGSSCTWGRPPPPVAYYQQVGRAGRATDNADVLLLPGVEDRDIWAYFATASMPRQEQADDVLSALDAAGRPMSTVALETVTDVRRTGSSCSSRCSTSRARSTGWARLDGDGAGLDLRRAALPPCRGGPPGRGRRDARLQRTDGCRMRFLAEALDDPAAARLRSVRPLRGRLVRPGRPAAGQGRRRARLRQVGVENRAARAVARPAWTGSACRSRAGSRPRSRWSPAARSPASPTSAGAAAAVAARQRTADAPADEALLAACVAVLAGWGWARRPVAVAAIPTRTRPQLVASVARHLAERGRLEWLGPLELPFRRPRGEPGGNSAFRLAGVWEQVAVPAAMRERLATLRGPVFSSTTSSTPAGPSPWRTGSAPGRGRRRAALRPRHGRVRRDAR